MGSKSELDFVDEDIAEYFRSKYPPRDGLPAESFFNPNWAIQMQLARYTKRLCELMERAEASGPRQQPEQW